MQSFRWLVLPRCTSNPCLWLTVCLISSFVHAQDKIHEAGEIGLDPPRLIAASRVEPSYPEEMRRQGVQGTVLLRLVVDAEGRVAAAEVFRSPFRGEELARAAVEAAREWRYEPARLAGQAVACRIVATVGFYPPQAEDRGKPRRRRLQDKQRRKKAPAAAPEDPAKSDEERPVVPSSPDRSPVRRRPPEGPQERQEGSVPGAPEPTEPGQPSPPVPAPAPEVPLPDVSPPDLGGSGRPAVPSGIEVRSGGPGDLILGQDGARARELLPDAVSVQRGETTVLRSASRGLEVALQPTPEGENVTGLHYVFADQDGFTASRLRTRKGLGRGSFCMGVVPAYGRPDRRDENMDGAGQPMTVMEYGRRGLRVVFACRDGRLAGLSLIGDGLPVDVFRAAR